MAGTLSLAIINLSILTYFSLKLLREGTWFPAEMYFFVWAYVFSHQAAFPRREYGTFGRGRFPRVPDRETRSLDAHGSLTRMRSMNSKQVRIARLMRPLWWVLGWLFKRPGEARDPKTILIFDFHLIGDIVLLTPLLRAVRKGYPVARIALVAGPWAQEILKGTGWVDEVIPFQPLGSNTVKGGGVCLSASLL